MLASAAVSGLSISINRPSSIHVMEWTHLERLVLGYISNRADLRSCEDLIDFWVKKAGPNTP